ncbi:L-carnitine dehydrogenase [Hartmannibacter diazotrophicus]|uniref:L-carnitine dehydrogenase n=1 Tax=Hartmannibacter diazotrophicus TaxID=1482074 RepID=A0A2C9D825_9HYPH|nr:thioesterase family protein [Hartmannibacter diazotrophicus]SON56426.1 L-carnitine dehydrogenase [Hartmannibacter diazotrophicus]
MTFPVPFVSAPASLESAWIDYNGHLNVAYYHVLFDRAVDDLFATLGLGPSYASRRRLSTFTVEAHVCYLAEVPVDSIVTVSSQLLAADPKRMHLFQEMHSVGSGTLHATCESLSLHVDLERRRACDYPPEIRQNIEMLLTAHAGLPVPERTGRSIALKKA